MPARGSRAHRSGSSTRALERFQIATAVERQVAAWLVLGLLPALLLAGFTIGLAFEATTPGWHTAIDFHTFWVGSRAYLARSTPYPNLTTLVSWSARVGQQFVYPPPVAAALGPLAVLPYSVAAGIFVAVSVAAVTAGLWLLGLRDWRCYGAAFLSPAVLTGISLGTLSPLLFLAIAAACAGAPLR
jgi:Glycosyltransferase family 87